MATYVGMTVDGGILSLYDATYLTARASSDSYDTFSWTAYLGQSKPSKFSVYRIFLKFDTSTIPVGSIVTSVTMTLTCTQDSSATNFDVVICKYNWAAYDPISAGNRESAWDGSILSSADSSIWRNTNGMSVNTQYTSGALSNDWVTVAGYTYYALLSSRDISATEPTGDESISIAMQNHSTAGYRPFLTIAYTEAPTSSIKTVSGVARASIKVLGGVALASVKKVAGVA